VGFVAESLEVASDDPWIAKYTGMGIWNRGGTGTRLARPMFPRVINVLSPVSTSFVEVLQAVHAAGPRAAMVSLLHRTMGFGREAATGAGTEAGLLGFEIKALSFELGRAVEASSRLPVADILLLVGNFADEQVVASIVTFCLFR